MVGGAMRADVRWLLWGSCDMCSAVQYGTYQRQRACQTPLTAGWSLWWLCTRLRFRAPPPCHWRRHAAVPSAPLPPPPCHTQPFPATPSPSVLPTRRRQCIWPPAGPRCYPRTPAWRSATTCSTVCRAGKQLKFCVEENQLQAVSNLSKAGLGRGMSQPAAAARRRSLGVGAQVARANRRPAYHQASRTPGGVPQHTYHTPLPPQPHNPTTPNPHALTLLPCPAQFCGGDPAAASRAARRDLRVLPRAARAGHGGGRHGAARGD